MRSIEETKKKMYEILENQGIKELFKFVESEREAIFRDTKKRLPYNAVMNKFYSEELPLSELREHAERHKNELIEYINELDKINNDTLKHTKENDEYIRKINELTNEIYIYKGIWHLD